MKNAMFLSALICFGLIIGSCKKEEDPEAIDKFILSQSGTYEEWSCNSGGTAQLGLTIENSTLKITKTGAESAEITCTLPVLGEVFKCNATVQSDTSLVIPSFALDGEMYDGKYEIRQTGSKTLTLYNPDEVCTLFGIRAGNVRWVSN